MAGGVAAFVGAAILDPRIGKYDKNGKAKAIPGHSLTLGALGCFILWFCWFGFNGASTTSMEGDAIPLAGKVFVTTNLAAAVATITTMIFTWIKYKKPDVSMTLNASLAGLVAITAPCDTVSPVSAAIIGIVAGILVVVGVEFIDQVLKIDDPVGACGVHMLNGMWGTIAVGLFSDGTCGEKGLFTGGGAHLLPRTVPHMGAGRAGTAVRRVPAFEPRTEANTLTERRFRSPGKVLPLPRGGFRRKCRYSTGTASALMQTRRVEYGQKTGYNPQGPH